MTIIKTAIVNVMPRQQYKHALAAEGWAASSEGTGLCRAVCQGYSCPIPCFQRPSPRLLLVLQQAEEEQKEAARQAKTAVKRAALEAAAARREEEARRRQEFRQETQKVGHLLRLCLEV